MWHILKRDDEYQITFVNDGNDPLYGYGSWSLFAGPFASFEEAQEAAPKS